MQCLDAPEFFEIRPRPFSHSYFSPVKPHPRLLFRYHLSAYDLQAYICSQMSLSLRTKQLETSQEIFLLGSLPGSSTTHSHHKLIIFLPPPPSLDLFHCLLCQQQLYHHPGQKPKIQASLLTLPSSSSHAHSLATILTILLPKYLFNLATSLCLCCHQLHPQTHPFSFGSL